VLSSDRFERSRRGAGIDTPDTPGGDYTPSEASHSKALSEGVSKLSRYTQDTEEEEREVFEI
jgi:hypothetical protein